MIFNPSSIQENKKRIKSEEFRALKLEFHSDEIFREKC
jgi:hypothetical protein